MGLDIYMAPTIYDDYDYDDDYEIFHGTRRWHNLLVHIAQALGHPEYEIYDYCNKAGKDLIEKRMTERNYSVRTLFFERSKTSDETPYWDYHQCHQVATLVEDVMPDDYLTKDFVKKLRHCARKKWFAIFS